MSRLDEFIQYRADEAKKVRPDWWRLTAGVVAVLFLCFFVPLVVLL